MRPPRALPSERFDDALDQSYDWSSLIERVSDRKIMVGRQCSAAQSRKNAFAALAQNLFIPMLK